MEMYLFAIPALLSLEHADAAGGEVVHLLPMTRDRETDCHVNFVSLVSQL